MIFATTPLGTIASVPAMSLGPDGFLGVGTVTPLKPIHLSHTSAQLLIEDSDTPPTGAVTANILFRGIGMDAGFIGFGGSSDLKILNSSSTARTGLWTAGAERVSILSSGDVGIGKVNPTYKLDVSGDINSSGSVRSVGVALTSDIRYKRDIHELDGSLEKVLNLRGVSYDWRQTEFPEKNFSARRQIGLIAQEVEAEFPELVETDRDGYKSVNYPAMVAPIIEAIRELYHKYVSQEERLTEQDRRIQDLEKAVSELKREVACQRDPASESCR